MVQLIKSAALALVIAFLFLPGPVQGKDKPEKTKKRITWEESEGVVRYDVSIKNSAEAIVMTSSSTKGEIEIDLPPGSYWIQITAVNKFDKISTQSDWQKFEIKQAPKKEKPIYVQDLRNVGLKISAGYFYTMPLDIWSDYYKDSYISAMLRLTLNFGKLGKLKNYAFFRYFGLEVDSSFMMFEGKEVPGKITFNSTNVMAGANAFFTTNMQFPLNLYVRFGGGGYFTRFEYLDPTTSSSALELWSTDPYFLAGLSLEITFYKYLYFELGADFIYVDYLGDDFMALRYIFMFGIRL